MSLSRKFLLNIATIIFGLLVFKWITSSHFVIIDAPEKFAEFSGWRSSLHLLFKQLGEYGGGMNSKSLIIWGTALSFIGMCIIFYRTIRKEKKISILTVYSVFTVFYTVTVLFMPVIILFPGPSGSA